MSSNVLCGFSMFALILSEILTQRNVNFFQLPRYQKTESVIKPFAERTTSLIGGFGSGFTSKLGQLKNSESFKSLEEKVGSAYENVRVSKIFFFSYYFD